MNEAVRIGVLAGATALVLFIVIKAKLGVGPGRRVPAEVKQRFETAKRAIRDAGGDRTRRAAAYRTAALIALDDLGRPRLAAAYARRAERDDPGDEQAVTVLARVLRLARRDRSLERLLYRRLATLPDGPAWERTYEELVALYEGPLRRPEQANALRRLRRSSSAASSATP